MAIVKAENARNDIPLVSVIAVCYNHSKYVEETLDSILNQTYENIELIIIDSNSPDNSVEVIENWIERNRIDCTFLKRTSSYNINQNLNKGIAVSKGEFVQVISCDDILLDGKIESQIFTLNSKEKFDITFSNAPIIDSTSALTGNLYWNENQLFLNFINNGYKDLIKNGCFIIHHSCLIRRNVYDRIGMFDEEYIIEDYDFFLRFFKSELKMHYSREILCYYRKIETSLWTSQSFNLFYSHFEILNKHGVFSNKKMLLNTLRKFSSMNKTENSKAKTYLKNNYPLLYWISFSLFRIGTPTSIVSKLF